MAWKNKVKVKHTCPYRLNECTMPESERCPCSCDSTDPVTWKTSTTKCASSCKYVGFEMSTKGWREKFIMLDDKQYEKRFGEKRK